MFENIRHNTQGSGWCVTSCRWVDDEGEGCGAVVFVTDPTGFTCIISTTGRTDANLHNTAFYRPDGFTYNPNPPKRFHSWLSRNGVEVDQL